MTDDEIEAVAAELAKAGGVSWPSGQEPGPLKLVMDRYRDRARLAIATLDRLQAAKQGIFPSQITAEQPGARPEGNSAPVPENAVSAGSIVL